MLLATIGDGALADALSSTNRLGDSPAGTLLAAGVRPLFASSLPRSPSFWRASATPGHRRDRSAAATSSSGSRSADRDQAVARAGVGSVSVSITIRQGRRSSR